MFLKCFESVISGAHAKKDFTCNAKIEHFKLGTNLGLNFLTIVQTAQSY